ADNGSPQEGNPVTFSWQVAGADTIRLLPQPGPVTGSSVTVVPAASSTYVLQATNKAGTAQKGIPIVVVAGPRVKVTRFTALPGRAAAGAPVTLKWTVQQAVRVQLNDGS